MTEQHQSLFLPIQNLNVSEGQAAGPGRKAAQLPAMFDETGQVLPRYEVEKRVGIRRADGSRNLRRLSARHIRIIAKHLRGDSSESVAASIGCTVVTISRVLHDPLSERLIETVFKARQKEIDALAGEAIDAVRTGLRKKGDTRTRLTAVDKYVKLQEVLNKDSAGPETAEDVIARMLERANILITGSNVQIVHGDK